MPTTTTAERSRGLARRIVRAATLDDLLSTWTAVVGADAAGPTSPGSAAGPAALDAYQFAVFCRRVARQASTAEVESLFGGMDVHSDGEVSWLDFSSFVMRISDSAADASPAHGRRYASAAVYDNDGKWRTEAIRSLVYLPPPAHALAVTQNDGDTVELHYVAESRTDRVYQESELRHETHFVPHTVLAVLSLAPRDIIVTASIIAGRRGKGPKYFISHCKLF